MKDSKAVMKRMVLNRLYDHLSEHYSIPQSRTLFVESPSYDHSVDAATAFKSDIQIEELSRALERIDRGVFGSCLCCGRRIPLGDLREDPCRRLCRTCEHRPF